MALRDTPCIIQLSNALDVISCHNIFEIEGIADFIKGMDIVIIPSGYSIPENREIMHAISDFSNRGGRIINFDYQVEKGSLIHVDERINSIIYNRALSRA